MRKKRKIKTWKRVVDNTMRAQGDIDENKMIIRINKAKSKKKSTIIDTIVHEETHKKHPQMHERTVYKRTAKLVKKLPAKTKKRLYARYRR